MSEAPRPTTAASRSAGGAFGLPGHFVHSRKIRDRETERIFQTSWLPVARVDELDSRGNCLPIEMDQHQLLCMGQESGGVKVFRNFCRHRGSLLVTSENCSEIGTRLQCPYHAWSYRRDGTLASAPNMNGVEEFEKSNYGLIEIESHLCGGFVWINFQPSVSAESFLMPLASHFIDWGLDQLQTVETLEYDVRANWKLLFQNYSECYHCPSVHPALNQLTPFQDASNDLTEGPILGGPMRLANGVETMSTTGHRAGDWLPGLSQGQRQTVHYFTVFPGLFLSFHPDYVLVHRIEPKAVDRTRVICQFLFHPLSCNAAGFEPAGAIEFWDQTNQQDWEVCERAQAGMSSTGYVPGPYSNLESMVAAFDRHYLRSLG